MERTDKQRSLAERSAAMRWKRPALEELNLYTMMNTLDDISENCYNVHWATEDDEQLLNIFDGDSEELFEFKMLFSSLEYECDSLSSVINDMFRWEDDAEQTFNDYSVALIGNGYNLVGYDSYQEDYFRLTAFQSDLAHTESGKRVMRKTKAEMLSNIGRTLSIIISFLNIQQKYEYLKATIDIFSDENTSVIQTIKLIEEHYEKAQEKDFSEWNEETREFDKLLDQLPERIWIE